MKPIYIPNFAPGDITTFLTEIPWEEHTPADRFAQSGGVGMGKRAKCLPISDRC